MDIFPTNLIKNIVILKSSSADLPADFTGGIVNIETKISLKRKNLIFLLVELIIRQCTLKITFLIMTEVKRTG